MEKCKIETYEQAVEYVCALPKFSAGYTLEDTKEFLEKLGNPEKKMKIIHVAGTNGKGSVCAYVSSLLMAAGYSYSLFTSPHLIDVRERFVINGKMIEKNEFLAAFLKIYQMLPWEELLNGRGYHPTFFEYLFFIAMLLFEKAGTDYCILETGLGGRLDATNAISCKEIAVITHMGLDHTQWLGESLAEIAGEKAGIMQNAPRALFWETDEEVTHILSKHADGLKIPVFSVSKSDYTFSNFHDKTIDFCYHSLYYESVKLHVRTIARYQMENAALALRTMEILLGNKQLTPKIMEAGLKTAFWAGRMEEVLPNVYVDGAHNQDGIRAFLETVSLDGQTAPRRLLFGVLQDKAYESMIKDIVSSGLFSDICVVQLQNARAVDGEHLRQSFEQYTGKRITLYSSVKDALHEETVTGSEKRRLYIAGSLYLVGEVKGELL